MNTEWSTSTKQIVAVGLVIFGLYILYLSSSVITLVIIAALIAFLLMPIVDFLHHRLKLPRGIAILLAYLLSIIAILLAPLIFIPPIISGFNFLAGIDYQVLIQNSVEWVEGSLQSLKAIDLASMGININLGSVIDPALAYLQNTEASVTPTLPSMGTIINSLQSALTVTYGVATNVAGRVFAGVVTFIVLLLSAVYISIDAHNFGGYFLSLIPRPFRPEVATLLSRLRRTWRAYFRGQLNLMIIIGIVTWLGNTALGLPGAFALGFIAGIMELVPNLGPFLAAIPAVIVALIQGSTYISVSNMTFALIIIVFYILVQQFENTFVVPRILGEAVNLHPLVVMLGVVVGANVAGILGALLAAPVIASGREIIRYLYAKILGEDPYPPGQTEPETTSLSLLEQGKKLLGKLRQLTARPSESAPAAAQETPSESGGEG